MSSTTHKRRPGKLFWDAPDKGVEGVGQYFPIHAICCLQVTLVLVFQGICATAIKKVCRLLFLHAIILHFEKCSRTIFLFGRKLGILKWPFRDRHLTVNSGLEQKVCHSTARQRSGTKSRSERASSKNACMSPLAPTGSSASLVSTSPVSSPATDDSGRDDSGDTLALIKPDLDDAVDVLGDNPAYSENCGSCGAADETERLHAAPYPASDEDERYWSDAATVRCQPPCTVRCLLLHASTSPRPRPGGAPNRAGRAPPPHTRSRGRATPPPATRGFPPTPPSPIAPHRLRPPLTRPRTRR